MVYKNSLEQMTAEEREVMEEISCPVEEQVLDGRTDERYLEEERIRREEQEELIRVMTCEQKD